MSKNRYSSESCISFPILFLNSDKIFMGNATKEKTYLSGCFSIRKIKLERLREESMQRTVTRIHLAL